MKNIIALLLLALWLAFGSWYYTCKVKKLCPSTSTAVEISTTNNFPELEESITPTKLKSAYRHVFGMEKDLTYQKGEQTIVTGPLFDTGLDTIAHFLQTHPSTELIITGQYSEEEGKTRTSDNIGLARAIEIQKRLIAKGVLADQLIIQSELNAALFSSKHPSDNNVIDFKFSEEYASLNDVDVKLAYKAIDFLEVHAQFYKDGEYILFSETPDKYLDGLKYYLNRNKEHLLQIIVAFTMDETPLVEHQDIGLLRALDLKQQLQQMAFKKERMTIKSRMAINVFDDTNLSFPRMVNCNFVFPENQEEDKLKELALEAAIGTMLTDQTMIEKEEDTATIKGTAYQANREDILMKFRSGSHQLLINNEVLKYVKDLKEYLEEQPEKEILIIGHTDNVGATDFNEELGRIRAYSARQLLVNNAIPPVKIKIVSEGEVSPIASNDYVDGRRLNRRVEIDIR